MMRPMATSWAALLALLVASARVSAVAQPSHLLVLAPADVGASLTVSYEQSPAQWTAEATDGRVLVVQTTSTVVEVPVSQIDLSNLSSIQVTWVPPSAPASSTFTRLFSAASPSSLPFLFSTGLHVQVTTSASAVTDSGQDLTIASDLLRALMKTAPEPLRLLLPELLRDPSGLARSLCASTGFTRHRSSDETVACFAAHFQLDDTAISPLDVDWSPLLTASSQLRAMTLQVSPRGKSALAVNVLAVYVTSSGSIASAAFDLPSDHVAMAVQGIDNERGVASVVSLVNERTTAEQQEQALPVDAAVSGVVAVAVLGEGFHRRVRVEVTAEDLCPGDKNAQGRALFVVPLSTSVYVDLDELRRMERFGKLTLYAPTKHIEIERPTAVSSQHVIAIEFTIDTSQRTIALEFPIHLRYQSPSNSTFYTPATLMAPDIFVTCANRPDKPVRRPNGPLGDLFSSLSDDAWTSTHWQRVVLPSPLSHVSIPVPVGFTPHGPLVSVVTLSVAGLGALLLVYVAVAAPKRMSETASMWRPKTK